VDYLKRDIADLNGTAIRNQNVRRGRRLGTEHVQYIAGRVEQFGSVRFMKDDFSASPPDHFPVPHGMVDMPMRIHDVFDGQFVGPGFFEKHIVVVRGIYEKAFLCPLISDQITKDTKSAYLDLSDNHESFSNPLIPVHHTLLRLSSL
jgi:hypothetical protein